MNIRVKNIAVLLLCAVISSCATTKIAESWVDPDLKQSYKRPLIIGISDSQQTRRVYENHFVAELKKKNITATASHTLISSKQKLNRETVLNAIQDTDIDSVLVTYLVSADEEIKLRDSPLTGTYSGDTENNMMSATLITSPGRYSEADIIVLKNDFYDTKSETIVFSAQTKTVAAESIDAIIKEVTRLLITALFDEKVFR